MPEVACKIHKMLLANSAEAHIWSISEDPVVEIPDFGVADNMELFCRAIDPFNVKHIEHILQLVEIGNYLV